MHRSSNQRFDVPVKFDDLAVYLGSDVSAPFVWIRVDTEIEAGWQLLWRAMRDPRVRSVSRENPFPRHLAAGPEELAQHLATEHRGAMLDTYFAWCDELGPVDLCEIEDDEIAELANQVHSEELASLVRRTAYRFSRELQAAYGRPSLALTEWEVLQWLAWTGLYELPKAKPSKAHSRPVGRFAAYRMRMRRD